MSTKTVLTSADLEEIRQSALGAANPLGVAAEVADAVEAGRLEDPADAGQALTLAAEIAESRSKYDAALRYADGALAAPGDRDDNQVATTRAVRARILFRAGRDDEAVAELEALRPQLTTQPDAAAFITAALVVGKRSRQAEEWLTEAVKLSLAERAANAEQSDEPASADDAGTLFFLLQQRHRLRHALGLQHDHHDNLAERLETRLANASAAPAAAVSADLVFFPQAEFASVLKQWPALAEQYGADWDEHRARLEKELVRLTGTGRTGLAVFPATADGLAKHGDPAEEGTRTAYARELEAAPNHIPWPPERNGACWCGSGLKYKKDCLPRSR
ncbi:SEC-C metal-binding domain-containing protein [Actinoplanes sp. Pm04-4]|uniref:SEC-C metal-binding domain-containing protein n=1 Tax=Paractinoplanes pyxinae TaxID=2997416 RepID=A0ABT4B7Z1_9ACTN|nr:SEC-C metal-binding domain-containing protein [Actinoplanes pyxinae]MCY1142152.1 SEC-C metal-binding domain-containing protein [Actinoplanes pyxinae]